MTDFKMCRRWNSDKGIIQSRHSRRIVPITRSQTAFAVGPRGGDLNTLTSSRRSIGRRLRYSIVSVGYLMPSVLAELVDWRSFGGFGRSAEAIQSRKPSSQSDQGRGMRRFRSEPRPGCLSVVSYWDSDFTPRGHAYWNEAATHEFTVKEVDRLEAVTRELQRLSLVAIEHIVSCSFALGWRSWGPAAADLELRGKQGSIRLR